MKMTLAVLAAVLERASPQQPVQPVWYNAALIAAAFTATATFAIGRYAAWRDKENRKNALLASLLGEIAIIRDEVRAYLHTLGPSLRKRTLPRIDKLTEPLMPTEVFDANVGSLGELSNSQLVESLTHLYARIKRVNAQSHQYAESNQEIHPDKRKNYFASHCSLLRSTVRVEQGLRELLDKTHTQTHGNCLPESQNQENTELAKEIEELLQTASSR